MLHHSSHVSLLNVMLQLIYISLKSLLKFSSCKNGWNTALHILRVPRRWVMSHQRAFPRLAVGPQQGLPPLPLPRSRVQPFSTQHRSHSLNSREGVCSVITIHLLFHACSVLGSPIACNTLFNFYSFFSKQNRRQEAHC